jgi:hypothetical protein
MTLAGQNGWLIRPDLSQAIKPKQRRLVQAIKKRPTPNCSITVTGHARFDPDLIDWALTFSIPSSIRKGMDTQKLKRDFVP